jgi:hypothetical protein
MISAKYQTAKSCLIGEFENLVFLRSEMARIRRTPLGADPILVKEVSIAAL